MRRLLLLQVVLLLGHLASAQRYAGPKSLGPFSIQRNTSIFTLSKRLGKPAHMNSDYFCYQSEDKIGFLVVTRMAGGTRNAVGEVMLSDFRNCLNRPLQIAHENLRKWKTREGIGLGSSKEDVTKAYGKPSSVEDMGTDYRTMILGTPEHSKMRPEVGTTILGYTGASDDLSAAFFGIRDGKVAWLSLSYNE